MGRTSGYVYLGFDDTAKLAAASEDPVGFIQNLPEKAILDEVERAPGSSVP